MTRNIGILLILTVAATFGTNGESTSQSTGEPSISPTPSAIEYDDSEPAVITAFFSINRLGYSEISKIDRNLADFISTLTEYIHDAFDSDWNLEYDDVTLDISTINDHAFDDLIAEDSHQRETILSTSFAEGMQLQYVIDCSNTLHCLYILGDDPIYEFDRESLELRVSEDLNIYFISTDAMGTSSNSDNSSISFIVESMMFGSDFEAMTSSDDSESYSLFGMDLSLTEMIEYSLLSLVPFCIVITCLLVRRRRRQKRNFEKAKAMLSAREVRVQMGAVAASGSYTNSRLSRLSRNSVSGMIDGPISEAVVQRNEVNGGSAIAGAALATRPTTGDIDMKDGEHDVDPNEIQEKRIATNPIRLNPKENKTGQSRPIPVPTSTKNNEETNREPDCSQDDKAVVMSAADK